MDITCFRLHQLEAITNNFSEDRKVGSGGYGVVYKAVLNEEEIAVKRLHTLHGLDDKDFRNELRKLNKVEHRNIIRLIGYCHDTHKRCVEYEGELVLASIVEKLLCFEYMQGGSLDKHIGDEICVLDWPTCYEIIRGTCEGLNHLHNAQEKPVFHLDLKPSHILLDNNMTPKIIDFGLATRVASTEEEYRAETITGTPGYMPPEYIDNGIVSNKFDVFSLGIIILRMMAGNKDYYPRFSDIKFIQLVRRNWKRKLQATLEHPSHDIDILRVRACVGIAVRCVNVDREKRPRIEDIVGELEELEAKIKRIISLPPKESKDLILQMESEPQFSLQYIKDKPQLSLQYLKEITNNFSHVLGKGGFAVVYKGVLQNGQVVAVKKSFHAMQSTEKQFENEVNLLMKLKHPNIVRLIGYCYDTQHLRIPHDGKFVFTWNTESLLCLEYVPNGTLEKYISDASSGLDWRTRCKIIEGLSYGLQYLQENSNELIIHLDLKPANILLDGNMLPKITDFGLSRLYDQNHTIQTKVISGTRGNMPPEYLERGIITPMSDIFSFGVIILEVITGHRGYPDDIKKESEDFVNLELEKWRNRLQKEQGYTSLEIDCHQIERCIQIGLICVNPERKKRPTMKTIIDMLQGLASIN